MAQQIYTASKSQSQGRPGWSMTFRHPLREVAPGKPGKKVRRGLGTSDEAEAEKLVAQMNLLLADKTWWSAARRRDAEEKFAPVIVDAFFDRIQAGQPRSRDTRDTAIPLPSSDEGFSRVLLVGTTGAGKTSLLRHIIGSHPDRDRFPSTSAAKTTTADIEVILREGPYRAVVTFMSRVLANTSVEECVADACLAVWEGEPDRKVMTRLLSHRDQRFRLSYVLGGWNTGLLQEEEDDWSFDDEEPANAQLEDEDIPATETEANSKRLDEYLSRVKAMTDAATEELSGLLEERVESLSREDREAAQEFLEDILAKSRGYVDLVAELMQEIAKRFDLVKAGEMSRDSAGWPASWQYETSDRKEFIAAIRWFSSNYAPQFGRLLTPLVDGVRVQGPLFPEFGDEPPKLVLIDGQGLGHTPDSSASVTTKITQLFSDVDVVLLVDNAQSPMQAAPMAVVRAVATGGHQDKLHMAFTHFDLVKGPNLRTLSAKREHVVASVTSGLSSLREVLGHSAVRPIERNLDDKTFMLGALDRATEKVPGGVKAEMLRMFGCFAAAIEEPPPLPSQPVYHPDGLLLAIQGATSDFQRMWRARLGLGSYKSVGKQHWARVKALNRRLAEETAVEYGDMLPLAELVGRLGQQISRFLDHPARWEPAEPDDEEADAALSAIRRTVYTQLHELAERRLLEDHLGDWRAAFKHAGTGSTSVRAREIDGIYRDAAPVPQSVMPREAVEFLAEVRRVVRGAIVEHGGKMVVAGE